MSVSRFTATSRPVVAMILDGVLKEGDPLPSRAQRRRGVSRESADGAEGLPTNWWTSNWWKAGGDAAMFVNAGAANCSARRRHKFLTEEWPRCTQPYSGSDYTGRTAESRQERQGVAGFFREER